MSDNSFPFYVVIEYPSSFLSLNPSRIENSLIEAMDTWYYREGYSIRTIPNPENKPLSELMAEREAKETGDSK